LEKEIDEKHAFCLQTWTVRRRRDSLLPSIRISCRLPLACTPSPSPASDEAGPSNTKSWVDPTAGVDVAAIRHTANVPDYARRAQCPVQAVHGAGLAFSLAVVAGVRSHGKKRREWIPYCQRVLRVPGVER
jgi:hypothetical protein